MLPCPYANVRPVGKYVFFVVESAAFSEKEGGKITFSLLWRSCCPRMDALCNTPEFWSLCFSVVSDSLPLFGQCGRTNTHPQSTPHYKLSSELTVLSPVWLSIFFSPTNK